YRVISAPPLSSVGSSSLLTVPDRVEMSRYTPMPGVTAMLMSPDVALTSTRWPDAELTCTSPLAVVTATSPSARSMLRSPDAVFAVISAAAPTYTSPDAVAIFAGPLTRSTLTSPLAVRSSAELRSPVQLTSADAVSTRQDDASGTCTTASMEPPRKNPDRSGAMTDSRPWSNSTRVAATISSPPRPLASRRTVATCVGPAVTVTSPAGMRTWRSTGSLVGNSQEVIGMWSFL